MTVRSWLSTWMRPRRSTWLLMAAFALTLVTYMWLRPPPVTITPSGGTPVIGTRTSTPSLREPTKEPTKEPTTRPTTVSPTDAPTTSPTTHPTTTTTTTGSPTPSGTPTTSIATTPGATPT